MKLFTSELDQNYATYSFGYTVHAEIEEGDDIGNVYNAGFLPYSHKPGKNIFYMARSLRLRASEFSPSSENRRIFQKFDGQFSVEYFSRDEIRNNRDFKKMFLTYFEERHAAGLMPEARFNDIMEKQLPLRVACYKKDEVAVGYVLEVIGETYLHYWFSCYELSYCNTSFGMWLMLDSVRRAEREDREFFYVGTGYGQKAKYKTNIPGLSFWDGTNWNDDGKKLKGLLESDAERETVATSRLYTVL